MRSCWGFPPKSTMIPNIIRAIKAITLMLENQNSSSPNTLTPRKLTRKTEIEYLVKAEDRKETILTQEDKDGHPDPYRYGGGPVVDNNACPRHVSSYGTKTLANRGPKLTEYHDLTCCINVIRGNNEVFHKIVPSQREAHAAWRRQAEHSRKLNDVRRMPEPSGISSKAFLVWEVGSHLSQADHSTVTYKA